MQYTSQYDLMFYEIIIVEMCSESGIDQKILQKFHQQIAWMKPERLSQQRCLNDV